ncbi:DUF5618 family protein [Emticicia sp.]|uniref:DUF5618 family protein n=1 Tax=Emticicia sp. TaxID=1930953 RepID=UPI003751D5B7
MEQINNLGKMLTPYQEANRYIANAKLTLKQKAGKKDGEYADIEYVQIAAQTAYVGVLLAIDEYLLRKEGNKFSKPKSIEEYRTRIAKLNKNLLSLLNEAYGDLYICLYYHGIPSVRVMNNGLGVALEIIEYIAD